MSDRELIMAAGCARARSVAPRPSRVYAAPLSDVSVNGELVPLHEAPDAILAAVASAHTLTPDALLTPGRRSYIVRARWHAFRALRDTLGWSLPRIAAKFGMHHTNVLHGLRELAAEEAAVQQ